VTVHSTAPLRIDFGGGWPDVATLADGGCGPIVTGAVALFVSIDFLLGGRRIRLHGVDSDEHVTLESAGQLAYDGILDVHKAALNMMPVTGGIEIISRSDTPPGSGLGSGALAVALLAGLARCREENCEPTELAELGLTLETAELDSFGWPQDHYTAVYGGFLEIFVTSEKIEVRPLVVTHEAGRELAQHIVLAYTGRSHFTAQTRERVLSACTSGDPRVLGAMRAMRDAAREAGQVMAAGDWRRLAVLADENWRNQRMLDAAMVTSGTVQIEEAARAAGAWGLKATGVGAGGCLLILCPQERRAQVVAAVESRGGRVLQCNFVPEGVAVWQQDDAVDPT
jgi:D-glycero-alpha-D-manno-heptose-7-phosphate kinase